jgi:hypothetical protein
MGVIPDPKQIGDLLVSRRRLLTRRVYNWAMKASGKQWANNSLRHEFREARSR